jgi:NAD(P)-dependent dehydrogenase (short-subunit alcohol dehydrogenase family)
MTTARIVLVTGCSSGIGAALAHECLRRQFDTNVIAPIQVTRAFLPLMLPRRRGCIVNVGNVSGILTTPFAGGYCASKAAMHALTDALRLELAPFGIHAVCVQPGAVASRIGETGTENLVLPEDSIYAPIARNVKARAMASQKGAMDSADFARDVVGELLRDPPPAAIRRAPPSFRVPFLRRWLPGRMLDGKLRKTFGLDRLKP